MKYSVEMFDTVHHGLFRRTTVTMPELTHYGYDGYSNYSATNRIYQRELMKRAKAAMGLTGVRGIRYDGGGEVEFRPHGARAVMFITEMEE